jgi:hypothetical protein
VPSRYWVVDPRTGHVTTSGTTPPERVLIDQPYDRPSILICAEKEPAIVHQSPNLG